jgi:hypothetical protein
MRRVRPVTANAAWVRHAHVSNQCGERDTIRRCSGTLRLARYSGRLAIFWDILTAKDRWTTTPPRMQNLAFVAALPSCTSAAKRRRNRSYH